MNRSCFSPIPRFFGEGAQDVLSRTPGTRERPSPLSLIDASSTYPRGIRPLDDDGYLANEPSLSLTFPMDFEGGAGEIFFVHLGDLPGKADLLPGKRAQSMGRGSPWILWGDS